MGESTTNFKLKRKGKWGIPETIISQYLAPFIVMSPPSSSNDWKEDYIFHHPLKQDMRTCLGFGWWDLNWGAGDRAEKFPWSEGCAFSFLFSPCCWMDCGCDGWRWSSHFRPRGILGNGGQARSNSEIRETVFLTLWCVIHFLTVALERNQATVNMGFLLLVASHNLNQYLRAIFQSRLDLRKVSMQAILKWRMKSVSTRAEIWNSCWEGDSERYHEGM